MEKRGYLATVLRFLRNAVLIDLGIFVAVGLVCWFGGWRTAGHYGNGLVWAGVAAISFGILGLWGNWSITQSPEYQYARSAGAAGIPERTKQHMKDINQNYALVILMSIVGVVSIASGILIHIIFGYV